MKTIVAIWNSAGKGKSSTILELSNLLINRFPNHKIVFCDKDINKLNIDFRLIIEINGKIVALESQGDPKTRLENRLEYIVVTYNPDLIICSCRTRGETIWAINNIAHKHSFDKIWTSTYETTHSQPLVNSLKGEHILDLVKKIGVI